MDQGRQVPQTARSIRQVSRMAGINQVGVQDDRDQSGRVKDGTVNQTGVTDGMDQGQQVSRTEESIRQGSIRQDQSGRGQGRHDQSGRCQGR
jgi:hypothetical protein